MFALQIEKEISPYPFPSLISTYHTQQPKQCHLPTRIDKVTQLRLFTHIVLRIDIGPRSDQKLQAAIPAT